MWPVLCMHWPRGVQRRPCCPGLRPSCLHSIIHPCMPAGGTTITDTLGMQNHPVVCRQTPAACDAGCRGRPMCLRYETDPEALQRHWMNYTGGQVLPPALGNAGRGCSARHTPLACTTGRPVQQAMHVPLLHTLQCLRLCATHGAALCPAIISITGGRWRHTVASRSPSLQRRPAARAHNASAGKLLHERHVA